MNYKNEQINSILLKYKGLVNEISKENNYDSNLRHLLYIIIPAFIIKYGVEKEKHIISTFREIKIVINDTQNHSTPALFARKIQKSDNDYKIIKTIIIQDYNKVSLMELLDSLVHEFNHAINSIKNEVYIKDDEIYLRTGISYSKYSNELNYLGIYNLTLEEIINTKQTELIIQIMKNLLNFNIEDYEIKTLIYSIEKNYNSKAYYLQSYFCREIMENKTFINTLEILRFNGEIEHIDEWFDQITGNPNSFRKLNSLLDDSIKKQKELENTKIFKKRKIRFLKKNINQVLSIVDLFNTNCNYK